MKKISLWVLLPLVLCTSCYTFWKHKHNQETKPEMVTVMPDPAIVAPKVDPLPWDPGFEPSKLPADLQGREHS